jgi:hypothetical protein
MIHQLSEEREEKKAQASFHSRDFKHLSEMIYKLALIPVGKYRYY